MKLQALNRFPMKFEKNLRKTFLTKHLRWVLLSGVIFYINQINPFQANIYFFYFPKRYF